MMATSATIMVVRLSGDLPIFLPSIMKLGGMFVTFIGLSQRSMGMNKRIDADSRQPMFWGTLLVALATIWAVNYACPGNGVFLVVSVPSLDGDRGHPFHIEKEMMRASALWS
jgi:hypothetical protein